MAMESYPYGANIVITATYPAAPTIVTFVVESPSGGEVTYTSGISAEVSNPAVGIYKLTRVYESVGRWRVRSKGTGAVLGANEVAFRVRDSLAA